jgi:hypothetical protein
MRVFGKSCGERDHVVLFAGASPQKAPHVLPYPRDSQRAKDESERKYNKYVIIGINMAKDQAEWQIHFYENRRGRSPVLEFINRLPAGDRAKINNTLRLLEEFGIQLGMPHARRIEGKLWELRPGGLNSAPAALTAYTRSLARACSVVIAAPFAHSNSNTTSPS